MFRRRSMSPRARLVALCLMLGGIVAAVVLAVVASHSKVPPPRAVTIPKADRDASPALIRAAEAVNFQPETEPGVGTIESKPASAAGPPITGSLLPPGTTAPLFTARTPTGKAVSLAALRGTPVLLEFFATWCPHCAAEAPHLQKLFTSLGSKRVSFVAVDANGADAASVFAYHVYFGLGFPAVLDPSAHAVTFPAHGHMGPISKSYHVGAYPTFYVLDRQGRVVWASDGEQPDALLRQELNKASESS
jgi:thiol-disulfide isomerase/thioredoxin